MANPLEHLAAEATSARDEDPLAVSRRMIRQKRGVGHMHSVPVGIRDPNPAATFFRLAYGGEGLMSGAGKGDGPLFAQGTGSVPGQSPFRGAQGAGPLTAKRGLFVASEKGTTSRGNSWAAFD